MDRVREQTHTSHTDTVHVLYLPDTESTDDPGAVFESDDVTVMTVSTTADAWDRLETAQVDCIVSGYDLPDCTGVDFLTAVREAFPDLPFVLYTAAGDERVASDAMAAGVTDYLPRASVAPEHVTDRILAAVDPTPPPHDAYYRQLIEGSHVGVYVVQDDHFVYANERLASLFGYTPAELCDGMTAYDVVAEHHHEELAKRLAHQQPGDPPESRFTFEGQRKDGDAVYIDSRGRRVEYKGRPAVMGIVTDVTERVEQARTVQAERDRLAALFENADDPILDVRLEDGEAVIEAVNDRFEEVFGFTGRDIIGQTIAETYVPDTEREAHQELVDRVASGERLECTVRRETADGPRDFLLRLAPYETESQTGTFGTLIDITERRERERTLERYREMADTAGDMLYILDTDGRFEFVSAAAETMTGYAPEELTGEHVSVFMSEGDVETGRALIDGLLDSTAEEPADTFDWTLTRKDGETIPVESNITLANADGEWQGTVGVVRDISTQKANQRKLERQNERLDNFASVVSHDLRNPLSVAAGYLRVAQQSGEKEDFERVADALDRMDEIIDDVLAMARDGEDVTDTAPVSLERAVYAAWNISSTPEATLDIEDLPVIAADEQRTRRLLENLFRNAIEHGSTGDQNTARSGDATDHGSTSLRSQTQAPPETGSVTVTVGALPDGFYVADDGPGIPEADRDRVFEHGVTTSDGPGLGLNIVSEIVEAHGWSVTVTESADGGARFEFTGVERASF